MDAVERASRRAAVVAHGEMSRGLYSLAAIAASAALVGFLGTVSQLLTHTFFSVGTSRSTALGLLAGRLSENLVFTALGLAVSIVAFIFYSHLKSRMEVFDREMEHAAAELVSRLAVHFAPAPKRMIESEQPLQALAASPKNQWFCTERMFQHAVLQLIRPRLTSPFDADSVLKGGMWISFAYGFIGWLN